MPKVTVQTVGVTTRVCSINRRVQLPKAWQKLLPVTRRLLILDEFGTTKMCSFCDHELTHPKEKRMIRDRKVEKLLEREMEKREGRMTEEEKEAFKDKAKNVKKVVQGTSICPEHGRMPRDPSASHNMSQCFFSLLYKGERPPRLQRPLPSSHGFVDGESHGTTSTIAS